MGPQMLPQAVLSSHGKGLGGGGSSQVSRRAKEGGFGKGLNPMNTMIFEGHRQQQNRLAVDKEKEI